MPFLNILHTGSSTLDAPQPSVCYQCWHSTRAPRSALVQRLGRYRAEARRWQPELCHRRDRLHLTRTVRSNCTQSEHSSGTDDILQEQDTNRLTTALNIAIAAEDYQLAAHIRDRLAELTGSDSEVTADWTKLGIPEWLAERAERIGYRFPTGMHLSSTPLPSRGAKPASVR